MITLIGAGTGAACDLTRRAEEAILQADTVLSTQRLAKQLAELRGDIIAVPFSKLAEEAKRRTGNTAILLSGDTGFYSAAAWLRRELGDVRILPGLSSMQVFCAKIGQSYDDACLLSLHGRNAGLVGAVSYHEKVFTLTGGAFRAQDCCRLLAEAGLGDVSVWIGENLGDTSERIVSGTAAQCAAQSFGDLAVLLVRNDSPADASRPLRDDDFARGDVPMTKQSVRWLAADLLAPKPGDVVYDIGAGTGSVTMELARRACMGTVFAVECKPEALGLIEENRRKTGNYHVQIVAAMAPEGLEELPSPDCVFVGGSRGNLAAILETLRDKNPAVPLVVAAITLETLHEATQALEEAGIDPEVFCVNVSQAHKVGRYHMMRAENPVYLIGGNL